VSVTYTLRYRSVAAEGSDPGEWTVVAGLAGTSHALTGLSAGVRYEVEVEAVSSAGVRSSALVAQRSTVCVAPVQPSVLPAGYVLSSGDPGTNGGLAASWGAVTGAQSYRVRHRTAAVGGTAAGEWVEASGIEATSRGVTGLDGSVSYDVEVAAVNVDGDVSDWSTTRAGVPARIASGGSVTTLVQTPEPPTETTYVIHTFAASGSFILNRSVDGIQHLVVAGGGGGGQRHGGGGGGGGVLEGSGDRNAATYGVTVGAGGKGRDGTDAQNGGDSGVFGVIADGGGRGGSGGNRGNAQVGGSGGGSQSATGAAGTDGQGTSGGNGQGDPNWSGGGGGGAGSAGSGSTGTDAARDLSGGAGGSGRASTITGTSVLYGGGGGGSMEYRNRGTAGRGGVGGGGAGGHSFWEAFNLRGILRWELYATSGSNPTTEAGFDTMIAEGTRTGVGYASIGSTTRNKNGVSQTLLDWDDVSELRAITGATVGPNDSGNNFALVVTGRLWVPAGGATYTFEVESDDSADVRIGSTTVTSFYGGRALTASISTGTITLAAGHYSFRVRQQDGSGGEGLRVFWFTSGNTTRRQEGGQLGPAHPEAEVEYDALMQRATSVGSGVGEIVTQSSTTTANVLNWTQAERSSVFSGVTFPNSGDDFAVTVLGTFVPSETGPYTFTISGDDAVDLWIDDRVVASHYGGHGMAALGVHTGTVDLDAGQTYRFRARQEDGDGGDGLRVYWRKPSQATGWHQDASELTGVGRAGSDGLGGGGGAGGHRGADNAAGGRGGSGVVVVRYAVPD
jgi:hypothetical protein